MKNQRIAFVIAMLGLSGCAGLTGPVIMGGDAAGMYLTKPDTPPAADTADQIPDHQSWCYSTAGYAECYAHPQNVAAERLINVDPQSAYPIDLPAYRQALVAKPPVVVMAPASAPPAVLQPASVQAPDVQLEKATLKDEIDGEPATGVSASAPPTAPEPDIQTP